MIFSLLGLLLLLAPLSLILLFKNRLTGFIYVGGGILLWQLAIAFLTQLLGIFNYPVVLCLNSLALVFVIWAFFRWQDRLSLKFHFSWGMALALVAALIVFLQLWSVHFNYSGQIATISGARTVAHFSSPFPYYSDEWATVAFANEAIKTGSLPVLNPLMPDRSDSAFPNIFLGFFALIAESSLLLNIPPLLLYPHLAIFSGLLISFLIFAVLRSRQVSLPVAALAMLSVSYITNGTNVPGLWYLLPYNAGVWFLFFSFAAWPLCRKSFSVVLGLAAVFIYPPLLVLFGAFLLAACLAKGRLKQKFWILGSGLIGLVILALVVIYAQPELSKKLWQLLFSSGYRLSSNGGIPQLFPWLLWPYWLFPFFFVGLFAVVRRRVWSLVFPTFLGLILWAAYSFYQRFFFIDLARVAAITSFLAVIISGFGAQELTLWIKGRLASRLQGEGAVEKWGLMIAWLLILTAALLVPRYTSDNRWQKLMLVPDNNPNMRITPAPPITQYLTGADYQAFSGFQGERFLAISWKGLVIGAATGNYPLRSKDAIVSNWFLGYDTFMKADCEAKKELALEHHISYVYSSSFDCPGFENYGRSSEGFVLYKTEF